MGRLSGRFDFRITRVGFGGLLSILTRVGFGGLLSILTRVGFGGLLSILGNEIRK